MAALLVMGGVFVSCGVLLTSGLSGNIEEDSLSLNPGALLVAIASILLSLVAAVRVSRRRKE